MQQHEIKFADNFPDKILEKTELQIFLGILNYVSHFYKDYAKDRKILNERLNKEPVPWTHEHTRAVQKIKARVKTLPILYVADDNLPKIVETDASNEGWGAVLKQGSKEIKRKLSKFYNLLQEFGRMQRKTMLLWTKKLRLH